MTQQGPYPQGCAKVLLGGESFWGDTPTCYAARTRYGLRIASCCSSRPRSRRIAPLQRLRSAGWMVGHATGGGFAASFAGRLSRKTPSFVFWKATPVPFRVRCSPRKVEFSPGRPTKLFGCGLLRVEQSPYFGDMVTISTRPAGAR